MVGMLPSLLFAAETASNLPSPWVIAFCKLLVIAATLGLPFVFGKMLARSLRMPDYAGKFGIIICSILASIVILAPKPAWLFLGWPPKLGIDLKGGVILVYEVDLEGRSIGTAEGEGDGGPNAPQERGQLDMPQLITALGKRINPDGLKEIVIRPFGTKQVEIIIPDVDPLEVERIKRLVSQAGILEFRIVANERNHADLIALAKEQSIDAVLGRSATVRDPSDNERVLGFWARVARDDQATGAHKRLKVSVWRRTIRDIVTKQLINIPDPLLNRFDTTKGEFEKYLADQGITDIEVLMDAGDGYNVVGADLGQVSVGFEGLDPKVDFALKTADGARRMGGLTGDNKPKDGFSSELGIVLDGQLLSAPEIRSTISERGQITGQFTQAEVEFLVGILRAGQLPAALNKTPVSENQIGSLLGGDMIVKSAWAIAISAIAVYVFVLWYYRFAGLIASIVLTLNIAMILALMILIQAPLTLPGLAGLVLTVGMAVDANVLIFERMREEQARGAAMRMVIRNGFDRAFSTILDSNITTVITAVILYVIGTDQVRGFAVTLTLGLVISMFTAVYCARVMFDVVDRKRWIAKFNMRQFMATSNYDFMSVWKVFTAASVVVIVVGLAATIYRGQGMFDIDFLGGTSVQPVLKKSIATDDIRNRLDADFQKDKTQFSLTNIQVAGGSGLDNRVFKIDTSIKKVSDLQARLFESLKDEQGQSLLETYRVSYEPVKAVEVRVPIKGRASAGSSDLDGGGVGAKPDATTNDNADSGKAEATPESKPTEKEPAEATPATDKPAEKSETAPTPESKPESKPESGSPCGAALTQEEPAAEKEAATKSDAAETPAEAPSKEPAAATPNAPASAPATDSPATATDSPDPNVRIVLFQETTLKFETKINNITLQDRIEEAAKNLNIAVPEVKLFNQDWDQKSSIPYDSWTIQIPGSKEEAEKILDQLGKSLAETPVFLSSSEVGGQVAADTQQRAIVALLASMVGIVLYIWLRFQHMIWGLAAVLALVHDVLVMLAGIALSYWLEPVFRFLLVEEFKINLTMIAAFLTLVGYSINDTIVLFDRLREIRGKSPNLTREMINQAINQTLSRTILTALTVFMVVVILYFFGGQTIHGFAFAMVVGTFAGSYSSIYIAAPVLLRMSAAEKSSKPEPVAVEK